MFAQQQQAFAGMQAYSQQISAQMPQPYQQTLASTGFGMGFGGGAYNYGGQGGMSSYGAGNSFGNAGISAMTSGMKMGVAGLGVMGGMGMLGSVGKMFDPFSMAHAGFSAGATGTSMGTRLMAGAGAAAIPMAGIAMAGHVANSMMHGAQQQAGIEQVLSKFQHQNASSRTGTGFSRQDSMKIGDMVRELAHIPDMLTSVGELTKVMGKISSSGMLNGVKDAEQFQKKFKETLGTIKDVARIMGTTLDEAASAFGEARRSGNFSQTDILKNSINRKVTSQLTGMDQQQVGQVQAYGAEVGHATGGLRKSGSDAALRTAKLLGTMNQSGILSNDRIMEMTGMEGAEGIQSLAGRMTEIGQKMSKSSLGTAMTLAMGEVKDGKYTGKMNEDVAERIRSGQMSQSEMMSLAHKNAAGRDAKLSFAAHRAKLTSEMASTLGADGQTMMLKGILGKRGFGNPDALNLVMQRTGMSSEEASLAVEMGQNNESGMSSLIEKRETARAAKNAYMNENYSVDSAVKKIGTRISNVFTAPFAQMGADIRNSFSKGWENFSDDVTGRYTSEVQAGVVGLTKRGLMGKGGGSDELASLLSGRSATVEGKFGGDAANGDVGMLAYLGRRISGTKDDKEQQGRIATAMGMGNLIGGSASAGNKAMSDFADKLVSGSSDETARLKKLSGKDYAEAAADVKKVMMSEEFNNASEADKTEMIAKAGRGKTTGTDGSGNVVVHTESALDRLGKAGGKGAAHAGASIASGDADLKGFKNFDLKKAMGGGGMTTKQLAKARELAEGALSGKGEQTALDAVKAGMQTEAGTALLSKVLGKGTEDPDAILEAILKGDKEGMAKYGITTDNAAEATKLLRGLKGASGDTKKKLSAYMGAATGETQAAVRDRLKERSESANALRASSNKDIAKLGGDYADHVAAGGDIGDDIKETAATLSKLGRRGDKKSLAARAAAQSELSKNAPELLAGALAYESGSRGKDKKGRDLALEAAKEKTVKGLVGDVSGKTDSSLASDAAVKSYFEGLSGNNSKIAQILGNVSIGKPPGEGIDKPGTPPAGIAK